VGRLKWLQPHECSLYLKTSGEGSYFLNLKRVETRYGTRVLLKLVFKPKRSGDEETLFVEFLKPHEARELAGALLSLTSDVERKPIDIVRTIKREVERLEDLLTQ